MKIAIISDIHANYLAIQAVEKDFRNQGAEAIWMLGDAFGRGPQPENVFFWMNSRLLDNTNGNKWLAGNHDANIMGWNGHNESITHVPYREIDDKHRQTLVLLKEYPGIFIDEKKLNFILIQENDKNYSLIHEFTNKFDELGYIFPWRDTAVRDAFNFADKFTLAPIIFFGHTHVPLLARLDNNSQMEIFRVIPCIEYSLDNNYRWLVNPGAVGAPADLDVRASYAIFDTKINTIQFRKICYDHKTVIREAEQKCYPRIIRNQLRDANLPVALVPRDWREHFLKVRDILCG